MSEEMKTEAPEVTATAENAEPKAKKKLINENVLEILVAIFLGITALLTAWATWIGSLHGGNQATNYTKSNNLASEGNSEYVAGMQLYLSDMLAWNTILDYSFDKQLALAEGNEFEANMIEQKVAEYSKTNCSQILQDAVEQMTDDMSSPFEVPGMSASYFVTANQLLEESREVLAEGQLDNAHGDAYNLVNVIYSLVLFMLGIIGIFKRIPNRAIVLLIAIIALVLATIYMCTIPMPTGFNLGSFFGGN